MPRRKKEENDNINNVDPTVSSLVNKFKQRLDNLGVTVNTELKLIPTHIEIIDIYSGGGFPAGGFVLIVGNPGTSKSLISINIVAGLQKETENSMALYIDAETSMTLNRLRQLKADTSRTLLMRHITVEKLIDIVNEFLHFKQSEGLKDTPSFIIWDSIAATPTEKEKASSNIHESLGLKSRVLSSALPALCSELEKHNTCMIAINQLRQSINLGFSGGSEIKVRGLEGKELPGGKAQYFHASLLLKLENAGIINTTGLDIRKEDVDKIGNVQGFWGFLIKGTFLKNKYAMPFLPFYIVVDPVKGVNQFWTRFEYLRRRNIFKSSGGWWTLEGYDKKIRMKEAEDLYYSDDNFKEIFDNHWSKLKTLLEDYVKDPTTAREKYKDEITILEEQLNTDEKQNQQDTEQISQTDSEV